MPANPPSPDQIFNRHVLPILTSDRFYGLCRKLTRSPSSADDLVQATSLRAWRYRSRIIATENVAAWVHLIARRLAYSETRHAKVVATVSSMAALDPNNPVMHAREPSVGGGFDEALVDREEDARIEAALAELKPEFRETARLRNAGLTYREIADEQGIPIGTVMSRLHRARRLLAEALGLAA